MKIHCLGLSDFFMITVLSGYEMSLYCNVIVSQTQPCLEEIAESEANGPASEGKHGDTPG